MYNIEEFSLLWITSQMRFSLKVEVKVWGLVLLLCDRHPFITPWTSGYMYQPLYCSLGKYTTSYMAADIMRQEIDKLSQLNPHR